MTDDEDNRRYIKGELDSVTPNSLGRMQIKLVGDGATKWLSITPDQKAAIEKILLPEPESPVSHAPCIQGTIDIAGLKSEFLIPLANDSVGFSQWGAGTPVLWTRVDLLDELSGKAREWADENLCRTCREDMADGGEGYDGQCAECADRSSCVADCSPDDEDLDGPCSECGTDWSKWNGEDHETFRREQREAREQDDNA